MRAILLLCLFSFFTFSTAYAQYPTNGLVAKFDFTNGSLVDSANNINFTQTGSALTLVHDRFGVSNNAINLGTSFLKRSTVAAGTSFTYSFWIKTSTVTPDLITIIDASNKNSSDNTYSGSQSGYSVMLRDGLIIAQSVMNNPIGSFNRTSISDFVADGSWHHIVVAFSTEIYFGGYDLAKSFVYVDGVLKQQQFNTVAAPVSGINTGAMAVGNNSRNTLGSTFRYTDIIDDIYIYDRELSASEIIQLGKVNSYCFPLNPSILTASSITETEMTINISDSGTYDIAYHKASENFSNAIVVSGVTNGAVTLNGLDVFTKYNFYVRTACVNNTTDWSAPIAFTTKKPFGTGIVYVNANANGNNNGLSWANAYTNLESALAVTLDYEEIWIAGGTYTPHATDRTVSFTLTSNNMQLYGGFNGTETQLSDRIFGTNETILSGDLLGNDDNNITYANSTRADNSFTVLNILEDNILLDGLTITGGHSNGANGSTTESRYGGGIHKNTATRNLTLTNCIVIKNIAKEGGGAMSVGFSASGGTSSLTINNCEFSENIAGLGGAIYSANVDNSTVTYSVSNSLFSKNSAKDIVGAGYAGSSMWLRSYGVGSTVISNITNCTFVDNTDLGTAPGMSNSNRSTLALTQNTGTSHTATISNSIFWSNKASSGVVANAIGGIIEPIIPSATINNCIDETNFNGVTLSGSSGNNSVTDPIFLNVGNGYGLSSQSPAIDTGNNIYVIGTTDLLGNQRIFNTTVDMGAYEFGSPSLGTAIVASFSDFTMHPNPTTSLLHIKSNETMTSIEIFAIDGKQVLTSKQTQVDVSHLTSGMYLVKITSDTGKVGIKKLVKQ